MLDIPRSGSQASTTSSRNRYGQYTRNRSVPVNPNSTAQATVRARLSANAAAWRALTANQRAGWADLGDSMTRTDSLGQTYTLTGFAAYCSVNNNQVAAGNAVLSDAPALVTPPALLTATLTGTTATLSLAYTATPLGAGARLFVFAAPQRSAGRNYEGDFRLIHVSAAAAASPANIFSAFQSKFGTPVIGNKIIVSALVYTGGFESGSIQANVVIAA